MAPRGARGKFVAAVRADDLRAHFFELALQPVDALVDRRFLVDLRRELRVAAIALDCFDQVALLLEHHGLVVRNRRIVRAQLFGLGEEPHRVRELAFAVEELRAVEEIRVFLIGLTFLLQLALKLEIELQFRDVRLLRAVRMHLQVAIDLHLRVGIPPRAREHDGHVVQHRRLIRLRRIGL